MILGDMTANALELKRASTQQGGVIFASPHSGRNYCDEFLAQTTLTRAEIRSSEDAFVDQLFAEAPNLGAHLLQATMPRAYLDLNRAVTELDPALIHGVRRLTTNPRVASGLGIIPRVVANGRAIYSGKITMAEAQYRIQTVWQPYHSQLQSLMAENMAQVGRAVLIDCHSMPHEAIARSVRGGQTIPQIVIGDRFGASASSGLVDHVESAFASAGFDVVRNVPFAGAHIARHFGRPSRGHHVIQIEIDRSLYMDEETLTKHAGFDDLRAQLRPVIAEIANLGRLTTDQIAAE